MAHIRTSIRAHVVEMIKGSGLVGQRVDASRARPLRRGELTSAFVYTSTEQSEDLDTEGTQGRRIRIKIDTVTKGEEDGRQDDLDGFALYVEQKFAADPHLGGLASATEYRSTDFGANADGEKVLQVMSITYEITALTLNSDPETTL
ncbi:hypothetical protein [Sinorhizobium fredii]|uniref:hypothetical protein n=1 Tax=Rhizobium fredii TaxID=380 RepID=UPI0004B0A682|nr:hypothetical protein [Sinorhizobium fredii]AWI57183.1 hypothetical protein AB395_00001524 [Sinorhizobium fredii CCBAU 45436]